MRVNYSVLDCHHTKLAIFIILREDQGNSHALLPQSPDGSVARRVMQNTDKMTYYLSTILLVCFLSFSCSIRKRSPLNVLT